MPYNCTLKHTHAKLKHWHVKDFKIELTQGNVKCKNVMPNGILDYTDTFEDKILSI